jgi:hypothetical protein
MEEVKDAQHVSTLDMLTFDAQKVRTHTHVYTRGACPYAASLAVADLALLPFTHTHASRRSPPLPVQLGTDFLGVLLNPPWTTVTPKQVEALALPKLCPLGFVFVWVEKEVLDQVVDAMVRLKYVYVENLTWVLMRPNNRVRARNARPATATPHTGDAHASAPHTHMPPRGAQVVTGDAPFIGRSHRTMLIFRRDVREFPKGKEIELRHQRSPDVEVQVVNTAAGAWQRRVRCAACAERWHVSHVSFPLPPAAARRPAAHAGGCVCRHRDAAARRLHCRPAGQVPGAVGPV